MDNSKHSSKPSYQKYCKCSAEIYSKELLKHGGNAHLDEKLKDDLHVKASKKFIQICPPKNMKKKKWNF